MADPEAWIDAHRAAWRRKAALRAYYEHEIFARILARRRPGATLEIGSGPGFLSAHLAAHGVPAVAIDVAARPGVDVAADAHRLPFADGAFANVVGVDVLHHLASPAAALAEAARVLGDGGRLILVEPWAGPAGWLVYRFLHHEACEAVADPWRAAAAAGKDPLDGNAAIPKALLWDRAGELGRHAPGLAIAEVATFGALSFLATGGFRGWGAPWPAVRVLAAVEAALPEALRRVVALRALFTLTRRRDAQTP